MTVMICSNCQTVLADDAQFCGSCGAPRGTYDPRTAETLKQNTSTNDQLSAQTDNHDPSSHDARIGLTLDSKYQLLEHLGDGAMGTVYRARRLHIGDEVAIKLMSRDLTRNRNAIERFRREARSAAMIRHPNVVSIHDFNDGADQNEEAYIVMELVNGYSLRKVLERESRLPPDRAVSLMCDVCAGVGAAHRQGLLHRDLKPDNVIVTSPSPVADRETAKVVDFGLAKVRDAGDVSALTQTGALLGTLYYMSPEQCRAEPLDARADVYSLGAMLYEMLTGRPPFVADNPIGLITKHLSEPPPPLPEYLRIQPALAKACFRALAKNREERQADAISLRDELQAAVAPAFKPQLHSYGPVVREPLKLTSAQTHSRTALKWTLGILAVVLLAVGTLGFGLVMKFGVFGVSGKDKASQNTEEQTTVIPKPTQASASESDVPTSSTTATDLRGTWTGTYGPLGQPATLLVKSHKGDHLEGVLEQGSNVVAFTGTVGAGAVHFKQTSVIKGEGWSLGEDTGTVSDDGKKMSGTGKDAAGGLLGMSYEWSFTRK